MHDMSKYRLLSEFIPYARHFFYEQENGILKMIAKMDFDRAWLMHQKRNKHHWSYWVMPGYDGGMKCIDMPTRYIKEMICDWRGAGRAQGTADGSLQGARDYYLKNRERMMMSQETRMITERLLEL
jgi:hypothetical protein